ncbi:MAG: phosphocholine-specific phospholipase C, partial [Planctomycetaceae bacterium]
MQTRREFMSFAASLAAGSSAMGSLFGSIGRAHAIEPVGGSSFLDAEHVVILMQENRSFDHALGTLRGVRGYNDPRAISLPDGNPVWVQKDAEGRRYAPFRLDIKSSKITWMGSLPHSWTDQVDARNNGLYDQWLIAKKSGDEEYGKMPLTLGYYTREDIPFYYALADAFTVCDQNFCSSLTGTTPNRCYLWSGTVREKQNADSDAQVRNENLSFSKLANWTTFPERLEDLGVSWKIYQNEITIDTGLNGEETSWLGNYDDNPIEYFAKYHVHLAPDHIPYLEKRLREIPAEIAALKKEVKAAGGKSAPEELTKRLARLTESLPRLRAEFDKWKGRNLEALTPRERSLHERAFVRNTGDPDFRKLVEISYQDGKETRRMRVPKGDVLHQFRADVASGKLPTVSWVVAPKAFSDHPSSPWFGAWYIAEVLDILTRNPAVWKKTVFILNYDENDGYFDHVPPFVAPHPKRPETGRVTKGIDASVEYVELAHDQKRYPGRRGRESAIGLGYRVPMIIASPWSRGGNVCSQVYDHTSVLQFLEKLLTHKLGRKVEEPNISQWRRAVCGDLTASFQPAAKPGDATVAFPPRDEFLESIHRAQFQELPKGYQELSPDQMAAIRRDPAKSSHLPSQEPGVRPSCPLPYELVVDGALNSARSQFTMKLDARKEIFGDRSEGSP